MVGSLGEQLGHLRVRLAHEIVDDGQGRQPAIKILDTWHLVPKFHRTCKFALQTRLALGVVPYDATRCRTNKMLCMKNYSLHEFRFPGLRRPAHHTAKRMCKLT